MKQIKKQKQKKKQKERNNESGHHLDRRGNIVTTKKGKNNMQK